MGSKRYQVTISDEDDVLWLSFLQNRYAKGGDPVSISELISKMVHQTIKLLTPQLGEEFTEWQTPRPAQEQQDDSSDEE